MNSVLRKLIFNRIPLQNLLPNSKKPLSSNPVLLKNKLVQMLILFLTKSMDTTSLLNTVYNT